MSAIRKTVSNGYATGVLLHRHGDWVWVLVASPRGGFKHSDGPLTWPISSLTAESQRALLEVA